MAELGYRLRRMDWGQGFASEGASALVNWGFRSGRYDKIVASTMAVNHALRRVMEKIGMNYARTVHSTGPIPFRAAKNGEVEYELMRSGWNGSQSNRSRRGPSVRLLVASSQEFEGAVLAGQASLLDR